LQRLLHCSQHVTQSAAPPRNAGEDNSHIATDKIAGPAFKKQHVRIL
jgi:hypothetical protein